MDFIDPNCITINSVPSRPCICRRCKGVATCYHPRRKPQQFTTPQAQSSARSGHVGPRYLYVDGASDYDEEKESDATLQASFLTDLLTQDQVAPAKVHFQPSPPLHGSHHITSKAQALAFSDPFTLSKAESPEGSDTSSIAELIRPSAFAGHRDTLARLHNDSDTESNDEDGTYTPTQAGLSLFRGRKHLIHRDTLARLHSEQNSSVALPDHILCTIASYLQPQDYKNMRLACRQWSQPLPRPRLGAAQRLPAEILLEIYKHLPLCDYDAARHTCKAWFVVGLDYKIAGPVLRSSGAYPAYLQDVEHEKVKLLRNSLQISPSVIPPDKLDGNLIDQEWLMSKRLATESRTSSCWRGSNMRPDSGHSLSSFTVVEHIDFGKLTSQAPEPHLGESTPHRFTASCCGKYLLLVVDKEVFVYSLCEPASSLEPVVRLISTRKILGVSMDTSSGRNSVAALVEGRLGLSWDLKDTLANVEASSQSGEPMDLGLKTTVQGLSVGDTRPVPLQVLTRSSTPNDMAFLGEYETVESLHGVVACHTESPQKYESASELQAMLDATPNMPGPIAIITRPSSVYSNLGTSSDSPRSVAICPQRKCVAFGCRSGIELHWLDGATKTNLNRWFPLTAPSDHLYFLPQRPGIDSSKKLRLISSAAGPSRNNRARHDSAPTKWKFRSTQQGGGRMQSMTRLFFGSLPFPSALTRRSSAASLEDGERRGVLRTVDCDHYRALPISDGAHMLFTDPATGLLCLGSDAPLGGPTKLMRKVCMIPPVSEEPEAPSSLICYRAGHELRWGIRVVAAYDDGRVFLYNIPADCFERIRYIRSSPDVWDELAGVLGQSDLLMDVFMASQQDLNNDSSGNGASRRSSTSSASSKGFRSLQIDGLEIYKTEAGSEVEDIQVDCAGGGVKIWLFFRDARAVRLSIYAPRHFTPAERYVGADGLVHETHDTSQSDSGKSVTADVKGKEKAVEDNGSSDEDEQESGHVKFVVFE